MPNLKFNRKTCATSYLSLKQILIRSLLFVHIHHRSIFIAAILVIYQKSDQQFALFGINLLIFRSLGGPLIRKSDGALVGVTSLVHYLPATAFHDGHVNQVFTNIHYFNKWITETTGIDLPNCSSANTFHLSTILLAICLIIVIKFHC